MTDIWYIETASPLGKWSPALIHGPEPTIEGKGERRRLKLNGSTGPRVRAGTPVLVNVGHHHLTLAQLAECYGPDGRFRNA